VINIRYYKWAGFAGLREMKDWCFSKINMKKRFIYVRVCTYQHSEGLIKPPIEARHAVEMEALGGFADHAAVLHRVRAYCKQWTNQKKARKLVDQWDDKNYVLG
jgi:hypothetical protein